MLGYITRRLNGKITVGLRFAQYSLELVNLNYREVNVNPCRIFYKVDNDKVYILHVMRQERDLRRFLLQS